MPPGLIQTIIEDEAVVLRYHVVDKIVHHELRQFVYGPQLRQVLERGLEVLQKNGATKWLSDDRGNGPLKPADDLWARTVWFPKTKAAGWKHWAVVMPEKVLGQMNMKRWIELYATQGIDACGFEDPAVAFEWLRSRGQ